MPTVVIGNNTGDNYSGAEDARIWSAVADANFGGASSFAVHKYSSDNRSNTCIKFSGLSNISNADVTDASLYIYRSGGGVSPSNTISAYRLLRDWIEGTLDMSDRSNNTPYSCCWNEYGAGNSWTTAGALSDGNDRSGTVSGSVSVTNTTKYFELTGSQLITDVDNFINGTVTNRGWLLERTDGSNDSTYSDFDSSEGTDGQRPYLSVTYTEGGGSSLPAIINNYRQQGVM